MRKAQIALLVLFSASIFFPFVGCSRQRYRHQADREVNELLSSVGRDKRWELVDYGLQPSLHSRFYDPYNPDCEPMPPDDTTAHRYMHYVNGKKNGDWDENGHTQFIENPHWQKYLPFNDDGYVTLDKETAFQLAQIHSPDYQTALENLYLSALAVSAQRFQFDTQFYGGSSMFYTSEGSLRSSAGNSWQNNNTVGFNKKLATGGQAAVELANSITWQLGGGDTTAYNTILSTSFLQPFLRNGGREYVLESLTRSERDLLANVRQMAFYRQGFYKTVIFGGSNVSMPTANGSPNPSGSGLNLTGGYVSLLASQIRITNMQNNVISKRESERQFDSLFKAGRVREYIQVEQARASYLDSQSRLMSQVNSYNASVEQFVTGRLGLPPDLRVNIQDPLLKQFEIMSPELTAIQEGLEKHYLVIRDKEQQIPDTLIDGLNYLCDRLKGEIANVYAEIDKLEAKMPERISNIRFLEQQTEQFEGYIDPASFSEEIFIKRVTDLRQDVPTLERDLRMTCRLIENVRTISRNDLVTMLGTGRIDPISMECIIVLKMQNTLTATQLPTEADARPLTDDQRDPYRYFMAQVLRKLTGDVRQLSLVQARARLDAISMTPIDITPATAIKVASQYRLDWMNARADLVNSWRDIEIAANQLQSILNFRVDGALRTRANNPVDLDARNGTIQVGVEWKAPLAQLIERNAYRKAQIDYQRARRNYYNYVDSVNRTLRDSLRNIDNVQFDFEVQRRAVLVAISRVHLAQLAMEKPPEPGQTSESMSNTLARDLVEALNSLLDAQNQFMSIWVDHYGMRSVLCLELGIMQLDENGIWLDPGSIREADYNQLVSRESDTGGMTLPAAPTLPESNMLRPAPAVLDIEDVIYPQELRQAPVAPRAPLPLELLPPEMTPAPVPKATPIRMTPSQMFEPSEINDPTTPVAPQSPPEMPPATVPVATAPVTITPATITPVETRQNADSTQDSNEPPPPAFLRRTPPEAMLNRLGAESIRRLPVVEEMSDEQFEYEMIDTPLDSASKLMPNTSPTVAWHTAQIGTGQSLQTAPVPVSVKIARTQPLPVPYSPGQASPSIEQVGYRRGAETADTGSASVNHDKNVVYINNLQSR
ncbi:MAG: hypothetical protein FWD31_04525 [Planctomycetaceae bacterium]|nr:hypothetical protein [Planctomycetaceae bacterium]